ncbi:hypothetical protein EUGRSUZ_B01452 [Eucalyptus grandis]|uniref:Uncharacterized protein n=2 Tax=Eucalyptus grandis TaxID=71139 RepID=A0ACC3LQF4_EUCGR|nr:hypothetical protein EUGRSUZ_B01452 [Eucalyptus grandis]
MSKYLMMVSDRVGGADNAVGSIKDRGGCVNSRADTKSSEANARPDEVVGTCALSPIPHEPEKDEPNDESGNVEKACSPDVEHDVCENTKNPNNKNPALPDIIQENHIHDRQCCDSNMSDQGISFVGGENEFPSAAIVESALDANHIAEPSLCQKIQDHGDLDGQLEDVLINDQSVNMNSATSALPPPEKLLSVRDEVIDEANKFLEESTPDKESLEAGLGGGGVGHSLGRKRSLTDSTVTMQESFELAFSKQTVESIPDDDDLLSSILVGRRSSVLKMKPSPAVTEVNVSKRQKTAQRASAYKRKVLLDDTMVLHGDAIRQQLMNTEDLRRVRRKAPCTLPEISVIQRNFVGDEIFNEPIHTGFTEDQKCGATFDAGIDSEYCSTGNDAHVPLLSAVTLAGDFDEPVLRNCGTSADEMSKFSNDKVQDVQVECNIEESSIWSSSEPKADFIHSLADNGHVSSASLINEENTGTCDAHSGKDAEFLVLDGTVIDDQRDFEDMSAAPNDTEFLNVDDDDEVAEDETMIDPEESRLLENSGWSSRTRAVAKYFQTLFHKEAVHAKRGLAMETLLAGKTRKEASRLFFESLVLKTRDYIHVEQETPFDNLTIRPGVKLMKSDF